MKVKIALLAAFALVLIAGCVPSTKGYEKQMDSWIGLREDLLVRHWGIPHSSYKSGESTFLAFNSSRNIHIQGTAPTYQTTFAGNTAYTKAYGGTPSTNITMTCETIFEIRGGRVFSHSFRGNDCQAPILEEHHAVSTQAREFSSVMAKMKKDYEYGGQKLGAIELGYGEKAVKFNDLCFKLWGMKISKENFIQETLTEYPNNKKELEFIADRIITYR